MAGRPQNHEGDRPFRSGNRMMSGRGKSVVALAAVAVCLTGWWAVDRLMAADRGNTVAAIPGEAATEFDALEQDIVFYEARAARDTAGAADRGTLAALYLQRARETGAHSDIVRAESLARRSLELRAAHNTGTNVSLISSLVEQHRFAEAREIAQRLVQQSAGDPNLGQYLALLGEVSLEAGDYAGARAAFDSLSGPSRGTLGIAPRIARWLEIQGKTDAARRVVYRVTALADSTPHLRREHVAWFHLRMADIEMRSGRLRGAGKALETASSILPSDYRILAAETHLAALQNDWRRVIELGDRTIALVLDPSTVGLIGEAYAALGDTAKAEEYYRTMEVAVTGQPGAFHRATGLFMLDHGRSAAEIESKARHELATRPDIYGHDLLAWALHKRGKHVEARAEMARALRMGTRDALLFYHAGMIERALGDSRRATYFLERAMAVNPTFDPIHPRAARAVLDSLKRETK